jgi:ABC-type polar amino acid transport system ATPase subunit
MIAVEELKKSFGKHAVLRGISMSQRQSETFVIIGPSGCGKSTYLRCLNQLEKIDSGKVSVAGIEFDHTHLDHGTQHRLRLRAGMVFQSFNLFPHLTVMQNITLAPIRVNGEPCESAESRARELLQKVGLLDRAGYFPSQLSGGQQQRAAIARAGDAAASDAVRRAYQRAGPGAARRSPGGDAGFSRGRHDDAGGNARNEL